MEYSRLCQCVDHFGEGGGNIIAAARIKPRLTRDMDQLHPDAVPFPFGGIFAQIELAGFVRPTLKRTCQHEGAKQRDQIGRGRRCSIRRPGEQCGIRRRLTVPIFLDKVQIDAKRLCKRDFGKPCRNADAQRSSGEFEQRIAPAFIQPVEQVRQHCGCIGARRAAQPVNHFGQRWLWARWGKWFWPQQAGGFCGVADKIARQAPQYRIDARG